MNNVLNEDTLLVCRSGTLLVVGRKRPNQTVDIVNAFEGDEAAELYNKLITIKSDEDDD